MQPALYNIAARKNVDLILPVLIRVRDSGALYDLTGWVFTMQVRREPDEPGEPLLEITNSGSTAADGIETPEPGLFIITITWETLSDPLIPAGRLAYDVIADLPNGERWGIIYGEFIARHGVTV